MKDFFSRFSRAQIHKKKYAPHIAFATFAVFFVVGSIFSFNSSFVYAATYTFTQTSWSGGATANTASHATDQDGWNEYSAKDSTVTAVNGGADVELAPTGHSAVDDGVGLSAKTDYTTGTTPYGVTIAPDGTSVYVANSGSNTVSMFTRNTSTGTLSAKTDYTTGTTPYGVAISADGTSVYVANSGSATVSMFTRNTSTGTLSAKTDYTTGSGPYGVAISADGTSVYVVNRNSYTVSMFTRNTSTGTLSAKTDYPTGQAPYGVAISADGTSVYTANHDSNTVSMFTRNTSTGTLSAKTDYTTGSGPVDVTISADGTSIYVLNQNSNTVSMYSGAVHGGAQGFGSGTNSSTAVSGSGAAASVGLSVAAAGAGSGADGAVTISTAVNINTDTIATGRSCADGGDGIAYNTTALTANTATLSATPSSGCLSAGDVVLLINLQGKSTNYANVGNYEFLTVSSVSTDTVTFTGNKTKYYGDSAGGDTNIGTATTNQRVVLQRVPQYTSVTISSGGSLTATAWAGAKGGVVALYASGTVNVASGGSITTTGKGFRGSTTGEGYYGYGTPGGGGFGDGGGDCSDLYGGGSYGTTGVTESDTCFSSPYEGSAGSTYGVSDLAKIYLGSGGSFATPAGGIVYVNANALTVAGSILNGSTGRSSGGSTFLSGNNLTLGSSLVDARGGYRWR